MVGRLVYNSKVDHRYHKRKLDLFEAAFARSHMFMSGADYSDVCFAAVFRWNREALLLEMCRQSIPIAWHVDNLLSASGV